MIYIVKKYCEIAESYIIDRLWEVNCNNVGEKYRNFMLDKAQELNISINPEYLNVVDNSHLTLEEFAKKQKQWKKIRRQWNINKFIHEILNGTKVKYEELYGS